MERSFPRLGWHTSLLGRSAECAALDELIEAVGQGESRSLVLCGEAGVGKSALLQYLFESTADLSVLRAVGVESEMELAYASLHQLCAPVLDRLEGLHPPQRQALEIVFGVSSGPAPDRFLVGLGVLSLLSEAAGERPLLCVIDDAQWIDKASALTLAFVARRLLADPVGIVFAAREPGEELQHLPQLEVPGLRNGDARALLSSAVRFRLDVQVRDRIIAEACGNPLALLELPRGLTATELAGGFGILGTRALSERIEESYIRRLETLPEDTRRLLLVAAADPVGDPLLLWRAAKRLSIATESASAAETAGLLAIGERVTFRHPLVRSGVYRSAALEDRRAVHLALAEATESEANPDRRAWHRAAAANGPDEEVALELERSAGRAQARGGVAATAAFLQRAVALTEDPARRADRALAAAEASLQAGSFDVALKLIGTAEAGPLDEPQRARVLLLHARTAFASRRGSDGRSLLLEAASELEAVDLSLARAAYLEALHAALHAGRIAPDGVMQVSEAVLACPRPQGPPGPSDLLLDGLAVQVTAGRSAAAPIMKEALAAFRCATALSAEDSHWVVLACRVASDLWDDETELLLCERELERAREAGALAAIPFLLGSLSVVKAVSGELDVAATMVDEIRAVSEATGMRWHPHSRVLLAALKGRDSEASALLKHAVSEAAAQGDGLQLANLEVATAVLCNGLGRYGDAVAAVRRAGERPYEIGSPTWAVAELIEAAVRIGDHGLAEQALERLADSARASGTDWGLGVEARSRALLSDHDAAGSLYREAIERLGRTRLRVDLARTHLLYGEWLRRERRRADARGELRTAHDLFTSMGTEAFAERTRKELLATGERARVRTVETRDDLTEQERQIAHLAGDGLSNPEIGARLFLSPRTVEWHLRKVFMKLGLRSRRELANALPSSGSELVRA